ncbi:MAG: RNA 2',3'-cyclic phosphodiesterase [Planctomycetota bacterium]
MRLFLGIFPPPELARRMAGIRARLEEGMPEISRSRLRWVRQERCHVTLRFLGEQDEALVPRLLEEGLRGVDRLAPFELGFAGLGAFPKPERARVLWLGTGTGRTELCRLAELAESGLAALGIERDARPFQAHFTLARPGRRPMRLSAGRLAELELPELPSFRVEELRLVHSVLGGPGSGYRVLGAVRLEA